MEEEKKEEVQSEHVQESQEEVKEEAVQETAEEPVHVEIEQNSETTQEVREEVESSQETLNNENHNEEVEEEENKEDKPKNNGNSKGTIIIMIIALLLVVGLFVMVFLDKNDNKQENVPESNETNKDNNKQEEKPVATTEKFSDSKNIVKQGDLYHVFDGVEFDVYGKNEEGQMVKRDLTISFDYPVIDIASDEIDKVNLKIYDDYKSIYEMNLDYEFSIDDYCVAIKKDDKFYGGDHIFYYTYYISDTDKYVAISLNSNTYTECAGGGADVKGYVVDKNTKKLMNNSEIIKLFNVSEKTVIDAYNENLFVDEERANSLDDISLTIENEKLIIISHGNSDTKYAYDGSKFEQVD